MRIKSPVTNKYNVILEEELNCQLIIDTYERDYNIDVSKYFLDIESVKIYKCLDTGYRFYYPFSLSGDSNLYEELQKKPGYYGLRQEHKTAKAFIKPNDLILEIGCGSGLFLEDLQEQGIICTGLEFNEDAVQVGRCKGLNILSQDICDHAKENKGKYDIVCNFQVLEHIYSVHSFLEASFDTLKPDGNLIIVVPNNNPFLYKYDKYHTLNLPPHHMGLWDKESLLNLQKVFSIKVKRLIVEQLNEDEYEKYFKFQYQYLHTKSSLLSNLNKFFLLKLRPYRLRSLLQNIASRFVQGRNILAVYTKN